MHYFLSYTYVDDFLEKRAPFREEHLSLARAVHQGGALKLAGAFIEAPYGAVLIFSGEEPSAPEEFVKNDPYVKNGLVKEWEIRPLKVVFGGE